jgi:hypothetical protein
MTRETIRFIIAAIGQQSRAGPILKTFFLCNLRMDQKARVFVPGEPFQPSLMLTIKARSKVSFMGSTWVGSGFTPKHMTRLERLNRDKHFGLLRALKIMAIQSF